MRTADVVIGAGFGDEGKGLATDYLAAKYGPDALVVRFNGGAQAGHTVETPDGKRHIFSHFGSGTLAGAATYLSRFFVCNPYVFLKEKSKLEALKIEPSIYVDGDCPVTTPYDMMINQIVEEARGHGRHGSCGLGFGETIERNLRPRFALTVKDLFDRDHLRGKLVLIQRLWCEARLHGLGVPALPDNWKRRLSSEGIIEDYLKHVKEFMENVIPTTSEVLYEDRAVIFEGAQGLMLDQDKGWFPHVTRSHTGLTNVLQLAEEAEIHLLNVNYMIRAYATRHGAGPFSHELASMPYTKIADKTNIPNLYQGTLRFGWLDLDLVGKFINQDLNHKAHSIAVRHKLGISCMDQVDDMVSYVNGAKLHATSPEEFIQRALKAAGTGAGVLSYGPTRKTICETEIKRLSTKPGRELCMV